MDKVLNLDLMANPWNWLIVFAFCVFALMLLALVSPAPAG
jgi:hypothetical protein